MGLGDRRRLSLLLIASICLIFLMAGPAYTQSTRTTIGGITFYVAADGVEKSQFYVGENLTLMAVASTPTPVTVNLLVTTPKLLAYESLLVFGGQVTITGTATSVWTHTISSDDSALAIALGGYTLNILVNASGNVYKGDLRFSLAGAATPAPTAFPWEITLAIVVIVAVVVVGGFIYYSRSKGKRAR